MWIIPLSIIISSMLKNWGSSKYLDLLQNISLHLYCHVIDIMIRAIIHYSILEHQHNVTLKFSCAADQSIFNVFLNSWQIHWPEKEQQVNLGEGKRTQLDPWIYYYHIDLLIHPANPSCQDLNTKPSPWNMHWTQKPKSACITSIEKGNKRG